MGAWRRDLVGHLGRCLILRSVDRPVLQRLAEAATEWRCRDGATLYRRGERPDELLVVLGGTLDVLRREVDARPMHLRRVGVGACIGWTVVLPREAHSADLVAEADLHLARIPGCEIRAVAIDYPDVTLQVIARLGRLIGSLSDELAAVRFESLYARVHHAICKLSTGTQRLRITQTGLAKVVVATRENVARTLADLEGDRLIERGRGWVRLL